MTRELERVRKEKGRAHERKVGERAMDRRTGERGAKDREHVLAIEKGAAEKRDKAKEAFRRR